MRTPCYVIDADAVEGNLKILRALMERTGCHVLLAQKAFSCYALYPLVARYLDGVTGSGLFEARLGHEYMPGSQNHVFSPAYKEEDIRELVQICDHIVFNSVRQLSLYGQVAKDAGLQVGLRVNPLHSTQRDHAIYDPCSPGSRLGVTLKEFSAAFDPVHGNCRELLGLIDGIHFHTLCEQDSDDLESTLNAVCEQFGDYLKAMRWINFGGGHHITRPGYGMARLERCIALMRSQYGLEVFLEPGEAIALNAGYLYTTVLEVQTPSSGVKNSSDPVNVIVDTSAACHMPDVIEMPYRPPLTDSGQPEEKLFTYRIGGPTCLAGDHIGVYSFDHMLQPGDRLRFEDMAIYSMVKNNTFNGIPLPSIYIKRGRSCKLWKEFGYQDFKSRL